MRILGVALTTAALVVGGRPLLKRDCRDRITGIQRDLMSQNYR